MARHLRIWIVAQNLISSEDLVCSVGNLYPVSAWVLEGWNVDFSWESEVWNMAEGVLELTVFEVE